MQAAGPTTIEGVDASIKSTVSANGVCLSFRPFPMLLGQFPLASFGIQFFSLATWHYHMQIRLSRAQTVPSGYSSVSCHIRLQQGVQDRWNVACESLVDRPIRLETRRDSRLLRVVFLAERVAQKFGRVEWALIGRQNQPQPGTVPLQSLVSISMLVPLQKTRWQGLKSARLQWTSAPAVVML